MPELRDETTEDGFHEIQFSSKQLVFLFMAASVILIFVFLSGVLVGRNTTAKDPEAAIASDDSPAAEPTAPPVEESKPTASEVPASTPPAGTLSYPDSLRDKAPDAAATKPPVERTAPPEVAETKPEPSAAKPEAPAPKPADAGPKVPTSGRPGALVIQIAAMKTRPPAAALVQRLIDKGYPAFLENPGPGVFRVRVGRFKDRRDAERTAARLDKEEGIKSLIQR